MAEDTDDVSGLRAGSDSAAIGLALRANTEIAANASTTLREQNALEPPHVVEPLEMWGEALIARNRSDLALAKFDEANKYAPNWGITQNEYDEKARSLKQQHVEIAARIEQHQTGDDAFRTTLETLISLASRAADLFDRSKAEQKRKLLSLVFSNLRLSGKKLEYSMRSPFDLMVNRPNHSSWLGD